MYANLKQFVFTIQNLSSDVIKAILLEYANQITTNCEKIIQQNAQDLQKMNINDPKYDRLLLNKERILEISNSVVKIAEYDFSSFGVLLQDVKSNGLDITKLRTPLGVVGIIYESRPNVTVDAISLCLKTQNVCLLKGSAEAEFSNKILTQLAHNALCKFNVDKSCVRLLDSSRDSALQLIQAQDLVDVCIARGSHSLIKWVRDNATVPFIETGAGVVHIYIDDEFDIDIAIKTILNSKTRRPSVCNSLDCVVISKKSLGFLKQICQPLIEKGVKIYADQHSIKYLQGCNNVFAAMDEHFSTEFLSLALAIKVVDGIDEAILHINNRSGRHSDAIITSNTSKAEKFLKYIDSSAVYLNTATSFTDGGCFGMLSEIGISTQKLHARGPFSLESLTTYKWVVKSEGKIRTT